MCTLYDEDFEENSLGVSGSALGSSGFNIGGATANQSSITITKEGLKKLKEHNALRRKARFDIVTYETPDNKVFNKYELGSYYVTELEVGDYSADLVMYDGMICFDEKISEAGLAELRTNAKTISEWVTWTISMCSSPYYTVSKDDSSINTTMLNGGIAFKIAGDSRIDTYRNLLEFLSVLACGYFKINTQNKICFSSFVNAKHTRSITSDVVSNYTEDAYPSVIEKLETSLASFDYVKRADTLPADCDKLTIALYENPFLRSMVTKDDTGIPENVRTILDSIANKVVGIKLSGGSVNYTSSNGILGNFGETVGVSRKVIPYGGEYASETVDSEILVTDFNYEYKNGITLTCNASVSNVNPSSSGLNKGVGYTPGGGSGFDDRLDEIANNINTPNKKSFFLTYEDTATNLAKKPHKIITANGGIQYRVTLLKEITNYTEWDIDRETFNHLSFRDRIELSREYRTKPSAAQITELFKKEYNKRNEIYEIVSIASILSESSSSDLVYYYILIDEDDPTYLEHVSLFVGHDQPNLKGFLSARGSINTDAYRNESGWVFSSYSSGSRVNSYAPKGGNKLSGTYSNDFSMRESLPKRWKLYLGLLTNERYSISKNWLDGFDNSAIELALSRADRFSSSYVCTQKRKNEEGTEGTGGNIIDSFYKWTYQDNYDAIVNNSLVLKHSDVIGYPMFHSVASGTVLKITLNLELELV